MAGAQQRFTILVAKAVDGPGFRFEVRDRMGFERSGRRPTGRWAKRAAKRTVRHAQSTFNRHAPLGAAMSGPIERTDPESE